MIPTLRVILRLALRNLREHRSKTIIIGTIVALGIAVLVAGNSLVEASARGIRTSFIDTYTADVMVSGRTDSDLSVFGFPPQSFTEEIPRIGSYQTVFERLEADSAVTAVSPQLTGNAVVHVDEEQNEDFFALLLAVDSSSYTATFPAAIDIVNGAFPADAAAPFLMLQENQVELYEERLGVAVSVGSSVLVTSFGGGGIRRRELTVSGVFRFRQQTPGLEQVALVDAQSFRSLQGLVVSAGLVELSAAETEMLGATDLDAMFGSEEFGAIEQSEPQANLSEEAVLSLFDSVERVELVIDRGAWHFLLLRLSDPSQAARKIDELNTYFEREGIGAQATDWRDASGGFSSLATAVQLIFTILIAIIAVVAVIIITNTLVISLIERTSEIGTMRALGARRSFVFRMFVMETLFISWVFGAAGIVLGALIVVVVDSLGIRTENEFLLILFGGEQLTATLSGFSVLLSALIVTGIGVLASVFPVLLALRIQPIRAVQVEQ